MWYFALVYMAQRNWCEQQLWLLYLSFFKVYDLTIIVGLTGNSNVLLFSQKKVYIKTLTETFSFPILFTNPWLSFLDAFSHDIKALARYSFLYHKLPKEQPILPSENLCEYWIREKNLIFCLCRSCWELKFRQVNAVFSPNVDKKPVTGSDCSVLMEFADTVAIPTYFTELYVQLQDMKRKNKTQLHHFGAWTSWKTGMEVFHDRRGQNWNIPLICYSFLISGWVKWFSGLWGKPHKTHWIGRTLSTPSFPSLGGQVSLAFKDNTKEGRWSSAKFCNIFFSFHMPISKNNPGQGADAFSWMGFQ